MAPVTDYFEAAPVSGLRAGLARGSLAGIAAAGANATSQFLIVLVVTRSLDPDSAGAFFTATALCLMLAGILRLDTGNGLIYALARTNREQGHEPERPHTRAVLWTALPPVIVLSILAACAVAVSGDSLRDLTGVPSGVWVVLGAILPVVVLADVLVSVTRGLGSMRPTLLLDGLAQPLGQLVLVTVGALAGISLWALVGVWALPALPGALLAALWLRRRKPYGRGETQKPHMRERVVAFRQDTRSFRQRASRFSWVSRIRRQRTETVERDAGRFWQDTGAFWRYTAPRSAAAAIQSVFQRLDIVIVAVLAGPAPAAVYTAVTRFKVVGQLANQGLAQAVQPRLVRALTEGDLARARELYQTTTMWLVALTWPIWLGYAALAPWLLPLFGPAYASGVAVALVLSGTMMVATACGMVDVVLIASGRTTASLVNTAVAVAATIVLDVLLVPPHGALGAALGWSGGVLVKNLLPLVQISRRYGLRPFGRHSSTAFRLSRVPA
ncbi:polysaccharide biosynthesis C-terminal domain-containing protein [Planotetraspora sp. A-T 1434]|uniref:lipopolysaccharide biosynthesis protein n=1 Tax=Planotetraspora sp. A-T 1434 TaxID=2979219 RepID=UPI0021BFCEA1|nr:polysaccharide biosynthesis C-terminal domain-containing protein [Planotetraspora sp. A-T 1434]MCT9931584.1 polysaccharide biosynthesis C-terminal domain-containing protein [Planotetraspora sp. A-T 1434]